MHKNTSKKGFTLVEIMIVVVIIGLLAAMAIPAFEKVRSSASLSAMDNDARQLASAAQQYMIENNVVVTPTITYDTDTGEVTAVLTDYVRAIGKGYTTLPTTISDGVTFSMGSPKNGAKTYTSEGQRIN